MLKDPQVFFLYAGSSRDYIPQHDVRYAIELVICEALRRVGFFFGLWLMRCEWAFSCTSYA